MSTHDLIKKTKKILTEPQYKFLKQLAYWSLNSKDYGLKKNGKTWIYNTHHQWAEQIGYGVTTVRESITVLERLGFISSDFLNPNKSGMLMMFQEFRIFRTYVIFAMRTAILLLVRKEEVETKSHIQTSTME